MRLGELHLSRYDGVNVKRVFRAGVTLFPYQILHLQMGDQVYCVGPQRSIERLADRLGNQVQKLDHPNIISIFSGHRTGHFAGLPAYRDSGYARPTAAWSCRRSFDRGHPPGLLGGTL